MPVEIFAIIIIPMYFAYLTITKASMAIGGQVNLNCILNILSVMFSNFCL